MTPKDESSGSEGMQYATKAPERMKQLGQSGNDAQLCLVMSGDGSKVQCCKEQYCIRTQNWKWVKQEMARVNINILGISELKWTRMSEFNSDDHYI